MTEYSSFALIFDLQIVKLCIRRVSGYIGLAPLFSPYPLPREIPGATPACRCKFYEKVFLLHSPCRDRNSKHDSRVIFG